MMKTQVYVVLRGQFGLEQEEKTVEISHDTYEDLEFKIKEININGRDLMLLTEDCSAFFTKELYSKLGDGASITAVFHTRCIKTKVHIVHRAIFGSDDSAIDVEVWHSTFEELVEKIQAVDSGGRNIEIYLNDGITPPEGKDLKILDVGSYENFVDNDAIVAIFHSIEITSSVQIFGMVSEDKWFRIKEITVSHYDFQGLIRSIKNEIKHTPNSHMDIFQGENTALFDVNFASYQNMNRSLPIIVNLDFRKGQTSRSRTVTSSFLNAASAFQQLVLKFKATPHGPSCDRPRRTAS
jgi:hypothetical protein